MDQIDWLVTSAVRGASLEMRSGLGKKEEQRERCLWELSERWEGRSSIDTVTCISIYCCGPYRRSSTPGRCDVETEPTALDNCG
ncbi:hypothetical protein RRG08_060667 [Elysia crispata]|uniref:Uncharacterized protein n=1 Tax=Elysia crispata TaxID=231223 RepID=A0AAE1E3E9_9GAST|nr:hypothetical protein RRG08_060667 [Elysia crispata]